jgi:hypothetical protein
MEPAQFSDLMNILDRIMTILFTNTVIATVSGVCLFLLLYKSDQNT